jgi:glycosyltransferase involved in cell wall biosynthesis
VLRDLYDGAAALVVTSRCEGFGLSVLEAMARRCPVACAGGSAADEIADGHAATFSPDSPEECAAAIRHAVALSPVARETARSHAMAHTWARAAHAHLDAYRSAQEVSARGRRGRLTKTIMTPE